MKDAGIPATVVIDIRVASLGKQQVECSDASQPPSETEPHAPRNERDSILGRGSQCWTEQNQSVHGLRIPDRKTTITEFGVEPR